MGSGKVEGRQKDSRWERVQSMGPREKESGRTEVRNTVEYIVKRKRSPRRWEDGNTELDEMLHPWRMGIEASREEGMFPTVMRHHRAACLKQWRSIIPQLWSLKSRLERRSVSGSSLTDIPGCCLCLCHHGTSSPWDHVHTSFVPKDVCRGIQGPPSFPTSGRSHFCLVH